MGTNASLGDGAVAFIGYLVTLVGMIVTMLALGESASLSFAKVGDECSIHPQTCAAKYSSTGK
jgi:hypothetical protein